MNLGMGNWYAVKDGDPRAVSLYQRHYSARKSNASFEKRLRYGVSGVGQSMVLITPEADALFVWQHSTIERYDHQVGVNCSVFRNEGQVQSSDLIREASSLAWGRWPSKRLWTYVWDEEVRSVNPGYCFKMAGWKNCGRNKDGRLTILEKLP